MALLEEAIRDGRNGQVMSANPADYHVPVNADVPDLDAFFVEEHDNHANPLGAKGLAELFPGRRGGGGHQRCLPRHRSTGARAADYAGQVAVKDERISVGGRVVFRSAKDRPFAERKATFIVAQLPT
jgi:hypothetical protein